MVDDKDKKDEFEITTEGEEVSYIGLDEARLLAMQAANENPGDYGRRYSDRRMAFAPLEDEETEEHWDCSPHSKNISSDIAVLIIDVWGNGLN